MLLLLYNGLKLVSIPCMRTGNALWATVSCLDSQGTQWWAVLERKLHSASLYITTDQPYVTTVVTAHCMYARHSVFRACISLVVQGARPGLEVAMHVHQCLIDLFQQSVIGEV